MDIYYNVTLSLFYSLPYVLSSVFLLLSFSFSCCDFASYSIFQLKKDEEVDSSERKKRMFLYVLAIVLYMHVILELSGVFSGTNFTVDTETSDTFFVTSNFMCTVRWIQSFATLGIYVVALVRNKDEVMPGN